MQPVRLEQMERESAIKASFFIEAPCCGVLLLERYPQSIVAVSPEQLGVPGHAPSMHEPNRGHRKLIDDLLATPFSQITPLSTYLSRKARFDTHQGVKGLEFERVMVIMDDQEARGFMFKYEDLFGRKTEGKIPEATRRLFYVTASRATKSLAVVAYTDDVTRVKRFTLDNAWFSEDEVITSI